MAISGSKITKPTMTVPVQPNSTLACSPSTELGDHNGSYRDVTLARVLQGLGQISVVVVDAPCFTLSHDVSLCEALVKNQCKVMLARSAYSHANWYASGSFELWEGFYPIAGRLSRIPLPAPCKRLLKTAEHLIDIQRFVAKMRSL